MATSPVFSAANATAASVGIRTAMQFGYPIEAARRPVFILPLATTDSGLDERDVPFDPNQAMPITTTDLTGVLCAYEGGENNTTDKETGISVQLSPVVVTLLEEEYQLVKTCIAVRIGDTTYTRLRDDLEYALGSLGVHTISFLAGDSQ
jgi:hypothetical protein